MLGLKDKVSNHLSRFFSDSPSTSSSASDNSPSRLVSKDGRRASGYLSFTLPSIFSGSKSNRGDEDLKSIHSHPISCEYSLSTSECPSNSYGEDASRISNWNSDVFKEGTSDHTPRNPLSNLMDDSAFVTPELFEFLESCIPNIVKGCQWVMLYSTLKHGISLRTLIRKSAESSGPCLLIVGDTQGAVFGGLFDSPLTITPKRKYQGTNQTFVFTTVYGNPRLFRPTGANRYYYMCMNDFLALGGGTNYALYLDGDLLNGTSGPCETYGNECLAHSSEFEFKNVELWGFMHASKH